MSHVRPIVPVLLVTAIFSRQEAHLDWTRDRLSATYGPLALVGTPYCFNQTRYYEQTMGTDLLKQLVAFEKLVQPDCLPGIKNHTNALEDQLASSGIHAELRPLNIDPGILSLGKFQLATTKDQAHRIYLGAGIFAEVTLRFEAGQWQPWPWTYADYRQDCVRNFLAQARDYYREQLVKSS